MSMAGFSEGGEPFSGWFGKQRDGKVRMLTSMARTAAMIVHITGLDTVERFAPVSVALDQPTLAKAIADNAARKAAAAGPKAYTILRTERPPTIDGKAADWETVPMLLIEREGSPNKAKARLAYDSRNLYALFEVQDPSPWLNEGKDPTRLFKTGDAVDMQIGKGDAKDPAPGDQRIVFGRTSKGTVAVLMRPVEKGAPEELHHVYSSPVGDKAFDRVEVLKDVPAKVVTTGSGYTLEAAVPLNAIGLKVRSDESLHGDLGVISSDAAGTVNVARTYWSNRQTNLVNDLPLEAWFSPAKWGTFTFGKGGQ
jgi:hypothetical protein